MKKQLVYTLLVWGSVFLLSSCRTSAPRPDYKALARASVQLGIDIDMKDNHSLYIEAAKWIGTPYRAGGDSKHGTDCSGLTGQLYKKVYQTKLPRSTEEQKKESRTIGKRHLREGDLVFFTGKSSGKKPAHVGIYLKDGKFIHASTSKGVIVNSINEKYYLDNWISGGRVN